MGCQKSNPELYSFFDPLMGRGPYATAFFENTQEESLNSNFDTVLQANVTFWNTDLREAYIDEMARSYRLDEAELNALTMEQLAEEEAYFVFIMTAHTRDKELNDFHRAKSSWRLLLEGPRGGKSVQADSVERVHTRNNPDAHFLRSMSRFGETYRIRFPKAGLAQAEELNFIITGPFGSLDFQFPNSGRMRNARYIEVQ